MRQGIISADTHLDLMWMPRDTWQLRLPSAMAERGPKVVETDKGTFWEWEDSLHGVAADGGSNATFTRMLSERGLPAPEGSLPPSDPELLLQHMDRQGIYASVLFGGRQWKFVKDPELLKAVYAVYNDFALELSHSAPNRLIVLPNVTARLPEECPRQIEQLALRGVKAVEFPYWDAGAPLFEQVWEPTWRMAEETGVALCAHLGNNGEFPPRRRGAHTAFFSAIPFAIARPVAELVFSGAFEAQPKLKFCFAETRVGWTPFFLYWMDRQVLVREDDPRITDVPVDQAKLSLLPSEYVKRNVVFTFEDDPPAVRLLESEWAGVAETALWGGDYPHPQGVWGAQLEGQLDGMFDGVDETLKKRVLFDHAAEFFGIRVPEESTAAR